MFRELQKASYLLLSSILLAGCGGSSALVDIDTIEPLSMEEVSGTRLAHLTEGEKEGQLQKYLDNSVVISSDNLIKISDGDFSAIENVLVGIDKVLAGKNIKKPDGTDYISKEFATYLALEFAKTPYTWVRTTAEPIGFDASSRLYFVDVTYKTTTNYKAVLPDSKIPKGSQFEDTLKESRYSEYMAYMDAKITNPESAQYMYTNFVNKWGNVSDILMEQSGKTLLQRAGGSKSESIGAYTYSGLLEDSTMKNGATMTIRYVFQYNYNLGEETSIGVSSLYIKEYNMDGKDKYLDIEEDRDNLEAQSLDILRPFIKDSLLSYNRVVEAGNHIGLNSLYVNYGKYDKYYTELNNSAYTNFGEFVFKIIGRKGTEVQVVVEKQTQQRGKGTNMSMPTYRDKILYNLVLSSDDKVKIKNSYLLERTLIGEPTSVVKNITGVSDKLQFSSSVFSEANEEKVMQKLKDFLQLVYQNDTSSSAFASTIDLGVSDSTMAKVIDYMSNVKGANSKVNYIVKWNSRTNVYVSLTLREIFLFDDYNLDTESTIEFVNRNDSWYVMNYNRELAIKTESGKIAEMKGVISQNKPEGSVDLQFNKETGMIEEISAAESIGEKGDNAKLQNRLEKEKTNSPAKEVEKEEEQEQPVEEQVEEVEPPVEEQPVTEPEQTVQEQTVPEQTEPQPPQTQQQPTAPTTEQQTPSTETTVPQDNTANEGANEQVKTEEIIEF